MYEKDYDQPSDELAEQVKRAAGGERRVSSYVVAALEDYAERENLEAVLASWNTETPVPEDVRRQVQAELDRARGGGLMCARSGHDDVIDVHVALCASERHHAIVTSDPDDMLRINPALPIVRALSRAGIASQHPGCRTACAGLRR